MSIEMTDSINWAELIELMQSQCPDPSKALARWNDQPSKEEWAAQFALALLEQVIRQDGYPLSQHESEKIATTGKKMADMIFGEEKADG